MRFETTDIAGLLLVRFDRHRDERGSFARTFCREEFAAQGLVTEFVQASSSITQQAGSLRGMHYQRPPHAEVKLVRCVRGAIYDVVADIRPDSSTYMRWQGFHLEADSDSLLYIPKGCAHGFQTLTDNCEVLYQMSTAYAPAFADGFVYNDRTMGITWPREVTVIAEKDLLWAPLRNSLETV
jgi:dTDP-4-dehydrorhamnose 3,5-epimerase